MFHELKPRRRPPEISKDWRKGGNGAKATVERLQEAVPGRAVKAPFPAFSVSSLIAVMSKAKPSPHTCRQSFLPLLPVAPGSKGRWMCCLHSQCLMEHLRDVCLSFSFQFRHKIIWIHQTWDWSVRPSLINSSVPGQRFTAWSFLISPSLCMLIHFCCVQLFATPWTVAHQALLSMGFSRQGYWSG